jgi:diguanylate cyclase (GGDEF)-like protein
MRLAEPLQDSYQALQTLCQSMDFTPVPLLISRVNSAGNEAATGPRQQFFLNKAFTAQLGYTLADIPDSDSWFERAYPDPDYRANVITGWQAKITESLEKGLPTAELQALVQCKNGQQRWFIVTVELYSPLWPDYYMVAFRDVHELCHALEENNRLSRTDTLTGLPNRREAQERLEHEWRRYQRVDSEFSVLLCDIDHFKSVNDELGHPAGDMALRAVAQQLAQTCRTVDCVSRWGGEEFLIILPATPLEHAADLAERLRCNIAARTIDAGRTQLSLRLSIGCASMLPRQSIDMLIDRADTALYRAKATGRNRVCTALIHAV